MQITNTSKDELFLVTVGRTVRPGESIEVDAAVAATFENHPFFTVSSPQTGHAQAVPLVVEETPEVPTQNDERNE